MIKGNVKVSTVDKTNMVNKLMKSLNNMDVLVGIPEEQSKREDDKNINNAQLAFLLTNGTRQKQMRDDMSKDVNESGYHKAYEMYIQSHGSPLWHSPPRPIIEPAIEDDKEVIAELLKEAMKATLDNDMATAEKYLGLAGMEAQGASQDWFTNPKNGWAPNAQSTIDKKGSDKPNISSGNLRGSITYVVRKGV